MRSSTETARTRGSKHAIRKRYALIVLILALAAFLINPALAGERFISGYPNLSATIMGVNEFSPGEDATIPVMIQNSGVIQYEFSNPFTLNRSDLPNTAKFVLVSLGPGDAPVAIRTGPQAVGNLFGGATVPVQFKVKIAPDAQSGDYQLPITMQYTYLWNVDQYGLDTLQYYYKETTTSLNLLVRIKPEILLDVTSVEPQNLNVGMEGYLNISVVNRGNEDGRDAVVKLAQNGNSPVAPVASSVYIGDFPKNAVIPLSYKVMVSTDAVASRYPVNLTVSYKNKDGDILTSDPITIGVPVDGRIDFSVVSPPVIFNPGTEKTMEVTYENTGSATVYAAQARIITVDPFTTSDDTSYLGDMAPGDTKTARFDVTVDASATLKEYALDSEVKYRGALNDDQVSDRIKVPVEVVGVSGIMLLLTPYGILVMALILIAIVYGVIRWRRKRSG
ncbi:MAG: S-layer protein [Methanoregulaceae archaeon]|nr:S-layer protein [Methanoregulaceae archaeon]